MNKLLLFLSDVINSNKFRYYIKLGILKGDEQYNISSKSSFLDLGSGYGLPNIHAFKLFGCKSYGFEICSERVKYSQNLLKKIISHDLSSNDCFSKTNNSNFEKENENLDLTDSTYFNNTSTFNLFSNNQKIRYFKIHNSNNDKIKFISKDIMENQIYSDEQGKSFTHIYCYGRLFSEKENIMKFAPKLISNLNKTNFKILVWNMNPSQCQNYGLNNCYFLGQFIGVGTNGNQNFTFYIYAKSESDE